MVQNMYFYGIILTGKFLTKNISAHVALDIFVLGPKNSLVSRCVGSLSQHVATGAILWAGDGITCLLAKNICT